MLDETNEYVTLGTTSDGREAVPFYYCDLRRHLYVIGKTGTGKSTLFSNLMLADLERGRGFALLDPHGDLATEIADCVPQSRESDAILLDPGDLTHPFGFNPLHNVPIDRRPLVAANIGDTFAKIWGLSLEHAPRLTYILMHSLRLLLDADGSTLLGLPRLLSDGSYRARLLTHVRDPVTRAFWEHEFADFSDRYAQEAIAPIQNKIGALLAPPAIRNMLGQVKSTIDIRAIMDQGKILIVNLSTSKLGAAPTHLIGALLSTAFSQAAQSRADVREDQRRDFTLYADEFQHFATDTFATALSEARKYRLALVLGHQFLGQVPDFLRQAVIGNAGSIVCFRIGAEDAPLIADELGIETRTALTDLANPFGPVRFQTSLPDPAVIGRFTAVRNRSRARYARPRELVERKIAKFLGTTTKN